MIISTEIHIDAPTDIVWGVLMDFASYNQWNPFIGSISGSASIGSQLSVHIQHQQKTMTFRPRVIKHVQQHSFHWRGSLAVPGMFTGVHMFDLKPSNMFHGGTHFIHQEQFTGLLIPLFKHSLLKNTQPGFISMNEALKKRSENISFQLKPNVNTP